MVDESKHTEEADISRFDYSDTHIQDTNRNLKRVLDMDISTTQTLDLLRNSSDLNPIEGVIVNDKRSNSKNKNKYNDEESKDSKFITQDLYVRKEILLILKIQEIQNEADKNVSKYFQRFHTDGGYEDPDDIQNINLGTQTPQQQQKAKFAAYQLKPQLPQMKVNIPLGVSGNDIFEIFSGICKAQRFQVIEMDQNIATAVNKEPFSIKRIFQRCFPFQDGKRENQSDSQISAVRLQISLNEIKMCRKITIKGLYGEQNKLQEFITIFKNKLHELSSQNKASNNGNEGGIGVHPGNRHKKNIDSKTTINLNRKGQGRRVDSDDSEEEGRSNQYNETSSIYQINKILSSDQYTLGKNVAQYIDCFQLQYKSLRESAQMLPQPETVQSFNSEYNLGKQTAQGLMPFCRPSVEKYVFSKLYDKLFAMYAIKNEEEDKLFSERSQLIRRQKAHDIMKYLGIKDQFIIGENLPHTQKFEDHIKDLTNNSQYDSHRSDQNFNIINAEQLFNNTSTSSNLGALSMFSKNDLPYSEAIKCMEKIQQFSSPREKLQCISESFGQLKTTIVDHWKGKLELNAMDDVLPLSIYVVAMSELSHPASEFNIMEDYLSLYDKGFEFERKLLTNFDVSIRYINHEWEIKTQ
ncbi:UNKNOWN [Stylonychia lemnae]|uniref:VPS9 domain-containing protein n=1 Tax=Stylonychia lemnae TaxID=5949 RepID=A0A078A8K5_STYLE|nr:UNKNOWN [Stylonychia lemnae]|eukprot:CDW77121.1 UNKNOWN [Stylonychia lemnae]